MAETETPTHIINDTFDGSEEWIGVKGTIRPIDAEFKLDNEQGEPIYDLLFHPEGEPDYNLFYVKSGEVTELPTDTPTE